MAYGEWDIGGYTPNWIITADYSSLNERKLLLHCLAEKDGIIDPRVEIAEFESLRCEAFTNTPLLAGGSCLQHLGGQKINITDGVQSWIGVISRIAFIEDRASALYIEFDIEIEIETQPSGGSVVYTPHYGRWANLDYSSTYCSGVRGTLSEGHEADGNEIGYLKITEPRDVKKVELYGSGCEEPAVITVNGEEQTWQYYHDVGTQGLQKLTFLLDPVTTEILITAQHEGGCANKGAWLHWIRVFYV